MNCELLQLSSTSASTSISTSPPPLSTSNPREKTPPDLQNQPLVTQRAYRPDQQISPFPLEPCTISISNMDLRHATSEQSAFSSASSAFPGSLASSLPHTGLRGANSTPVAHHNIVRVCCDPRPWVERALQALRCVSLWQMRAGTHADRMRVRRERMCSRRRRTTDRVTSYFCHAYACTRVHSSIHHLIPWSGFIPFLLLFSSSSFGCEDNSVRGHVLRFWPP